MFNKAEKSSSAIWMHKPTRPETKLANLRNDEVPDGGADERIVPSRRSTYAKQKPTSCCAGPWLRSCNSNLKITQNSSIEYRNLTKIDLTLSQWTFSLHLSQLFEAFFQGNFSKEIFKKTVWWSWFVFEKSDEDGRLCPMYPPTKRCGMTSLLIIYFNLHKMLHPCVRALQQASTRRWSFRHQFRRQLKRPERQAGTVPAPHTLDIYWTFHVLKFWHSLCSFLQGTVAPRVKAPPIQGRRTASSVPETWIKFSESVTVLPDFQITWWFDQVITWHFEDLQRQSTFIIDE